MRDTGETEGASSSFFFFFFFMKWIPPSTGMSNVKPAAAMENMQEKTAMFMPPVPTVSVEKGMEYRRE